MNDGWSFFLANFSPGPLQNAFIVLSIDCLTSWQKTVGITLILDRDYRAFFGVEILSQSTVMIEQ